MTKPLLTGAAISICFHIIILIYSEYDPFVKQENRKSEKIEISFFSKTGDKSLENENIRREEEKEDIKEDIKKDIKEEKTLKDNLPLKKAFSYKKKPVENNNIIKKQENHPIENISDITASENENIKTLPSENFSSDISINTVQNFDKKARALKMPKPAYPKTSRRKGEEGTVIFLITVNEEGKAEYIKIISSSGYDALDKAALAVIPKAIFEAAERKGKKVKSDIKIKLRFSLKD